MKTLQKIGKWILNAALKAISLIFEVSGVILLAIGTILYGLSIFIENPKTSISAVKELLKKKAANV